MKTKLLKRLRKKFHKNYKIVRHDGKYWIYKWDKVARVWKTCLFVIETGSEMNIIEQFNFCWRVFASVEIGNIRKQKTRIEL